MKRLLWVSRGEKPVIVLVLDADSAQWIADHIPKGDRARDELISALVENPSVNTGDGRGWDREGAPAQSATGDTRPSELCEGANRD